MSKENADLAASVVAHLPTKSKKDRLKVKPMDDTEMRMVDFLFDEGRIPLGGVTLVAGEGGLGKSTYAILVAARVTRSGQAVLIISTEDDWHTTIAPRLVASEANMALVYSVVLAADDEPTGLRFPDDLEELEALTDEIADLGLIIIDPVSAQINPDKINANSDGEVRSYMLDPLGRIARKRGLAVIAIAHLNKREGSGALYRIAGSSGFPNSVRSVLMWGIPQHADRRDPDRYLTHPKCNVGKLRDTEHYKIEVVSVDDADGNPMETTRVVHSGVSLYTAEDLFTKPKVGGSGGEKKETAEDLLRHLWRMAKGPIESELARSKGAVANISERTMRRALTDLGGTARRDGFGGKTSWVPPNGFFGDEPEPVQVELPDELPDEKPDPM